jgi:hypothetical protein
VTSGGTLNVTYERLVNPLGGASAIFHRRSTDGGVSFGPPDTVTTVAGDAILELPVLAARPNGDLLACWAQHAGANERSNQVRCAICPAGGTWSRPNAVDSGLPSDAAEAWPAIAGTDRGWYLMQYVARSSRTAVILYRSTDGAAFERVATLATMEGLGYDRLCPNSTTPCRRTPTRADGFVMGDYITLAASGGRLAAAYVLPRRAGSKPEKAAVYVSVLQEPPAH